MTSTMPHLRTSAEDWVSAVQDDLKDVEARMRQSAQMGQKTLDRAVDAIIQAGGKRLRPSITILMGRHFQAEWERVLPVAASIELLHTATLVHDDLIDAAEERRGTPTLHSQLPIGITVLTGDFLFAQAAALAAEADNLRVVKLFSETLVRICKGEILQARSRWQVPTEALYEERIYGKTAALFESAAAVGAILSDANEAEIVAAEDYGRKLGLAFQIIDDALDFQSTTDRLGKPVGHDMRQGILNLPVMYYVQGGYITQDALQERLQAQDDLTALIEDIRQTGSVQQSVDVAKTYVQEAIQALENTGHGNQAVLEALYQVAEYALARAY